jgi:peptidoglycan/LPS O-acetylase OafA/YrhL
MRKAIVLVVIALLVLAGMVVWLFKSPELDFREYGMIGIQVVVVAFAVLVIVRRFRDARDKVPTEDEMSKKTMRRTAATSYYVSIYMWLAFMMFEDSIQLERYSLIGAGILGMALIFALSWVYHNYIRKSHD